MTDMAPPYHKNPCSGVIKLTIMVDPFFVMITINLECLTYAQD